LPDIPSFTNEFLSRNADVVTVQEQSALRALHILIAGCGSVGGAVVEPLVRLGVGALRLADPDVFATSNLNRQACTVHDLGRYKTDVLLERALSINPFVQVESMSGGLTPDNVENAVVGCGAIFDGVDGSASPWVKWLLHACAAAHRIPVIAGADFGGKAVLYIFDYRRHPVPFYGRSSEEAHRRGDFVQAVRWLGRRHFPADFLPIVSDRLLTGEPWPQVSYCAMTLGALASRTIIDVVLGRRVPHVVSSDIHMKVRPLHSRLAMLARQPIALLRTLRELRQGPVAATIVARQKELRLPAFLAPIAEAIRGAPSAHNTQPWRVLVRTDRCIEIGWQRARQLHVADSDARGLCLSLGCAIEAVNTVAHIDLVAHAGVDPLASDWHGGRLEISGIREKTYYRDAGVLAFRSTNRHAFLTVSPDRRIMRACEEQGATFGVTTAVSSDRRVLDSLRDLTAAAARQHFQQDEYLAELLLWTRFTDAEQRRAKDGFTPQTLGIDPLTAAVLRGLRSSSLLRAGARRAGLAQAMAAVAASAFVHCGGALAICTDDLSPKGLISSGRAMMAIWIELTRSNLAVQPVFFPLGTPAHRRDVRNLFGVSSGDVVALLRIGVPTRAATRSPRLALDTICEVTT